MDYNIIIESVNKTDFWKVKRNIYFNKYYYFTDYSSGQVDALNKLLLEKLKTNNRG